MTETHHALEQFLQLPDIDAGDDRQVEFAVDPTQQHVIMRGDPGDSGFLDAVSGVLGQNVPLQHNTTSRGEHVVLWLGPDEWLILTRQYAGPLIEQLRTAVNDRFVTFTDVSDGQIKLQLSGERARDVLSKGCTLDLHQGTFTPGSCAQTALAKSSVLITLQAEGSCFDIVVRRSFAEYVALWLRHAAAEYGFRCKTPT